MSKTTKKPTALDIENIRKLYFEYVKPQETSVSTPELSTTTKSDLPDGNVVDMHKTEKGNLSVRGFLKKELYMEITKDREGQMKPILSSFPAKQHGKEILIGGKPKYIRFVPNENISLFEQACATHGVKINYV